MRSILPKVAALVLILGTLVPSLGHARNGAHLILDLRIKLGQTTASNSNWTDAQLLSCLNQGQDYISALGRVVERSDTLAASGIRVAYPDSFLLLRPGAWLWRNGKEVRSIPLISLDSMFNLLSRPSPQLAGNDVYYLADEGTKLVVTPPLNSGDSLLVQFYRRPDTLISTDTTSGECLYPREWEIVLLAAAKVFALEKTRDAAWYDRAVAERDKMVASLYQQTKMKPQLSNVP